MSVPAPPPGLPTGDWQFWVVTIAAVIAAVWLLFTLTPAKKLVRRQASASRKRVRLTVSANSDEASA
ncbi:MAG: hypothetical protein AAGK04_03595 [Planctomycetota bacterium]